MVNIFMLSWNLRQNALWHFDRHLAKLPVEAAQLASQVHHRLNSPFKADAEVYRDSRAVRFNPLVAWAAEHPNHYRFVVNYGLAVAEEFQRRVAVNKSRAHKSIATLEYLRAHEPHWPATIGQGKLSPHKFVRWPPPSVPGVALTTNTANNNSISNSETKTDAQDDVDVLQVYREYYQSDAKAHLRQWRGLQAPPWFKDTKLKSKPIETKEKSKKKTSKSKTETKTTTKTKRKKTTSITEDEDDNNKKRKRNVL